MRGRRKIFPVFIVFFLLSLFISLFSQKGLINGVTGFLQTIVLPVQRSSFIFSRGFSKGDSNSELEKLKQENRNLLTKLAKMKALEKDNKALRDQFTTVNPKPESLLPSYIVSMPAFLPGISVVDKIVIDKGSEDKLKDGDSVVFKDNLIGKVAKASPHLSVIYLLNHKGISFTAKTSETSALGIIQGTGEDKIILNNVVLSDTLRKGDIVVTYKNLVIGKIVSINKKASELFQSAEVERLFDVSKLDIVFVVLGE